MSDPTRLEAASYRAVGPGTFAALHNAIKYRMALVAEQFWSLSTKTTERAPSIIDGWLPPSEVGAEQFPFIIVRPRICTDAPQGADESSAASVDIIVGTLSDTDDGWIDVMQIMDAIRLDLGAAPAIESTAFEQVGPLIAELNEQQARPQWFGKVTTIWTIPRPRRVEALNPNKDTST